MQAALMRAFAGKHAAEATAGAAARAALASELGVAVEDISEEDLAIGDHDEDLFRDLTEEELDALLAAEGEA